jgi:high-affinity Fe2+/Pb2+ permease
MIACLPVDSENASQLIGAIAKRLPSIFLFVLIFCALVFWALGELPSNLPQQYIMFTYSFAFIMCFIFAGVAIAIEYRRNSK